MITIFDGNLKEIIDALRFGQLLIGFAVWGSRGGLLRWEVVDSPAVNPRYFVAELMAQVDRCWVQSSLGGFRPEFELIAATPALVAVVAVQSNVHRERSAMLGL